MATLTCIRHICFLGVPPRLERLHRLTRALLLLVVAALAGCAETGYYVQSATGHLALMRAARPVADWLQDPQASPDLKSRLEMAQRIREFAATELGLPDNPSYHRYADLKRRSVVWNVVAAPEFSVTLKTWCFPVAGCVGYRGYFDEAQAKALATELKAQGLEVSVYGVPAYSTLGWMNWAGGDPLLNTFINYPQGELARLIFHELAHQVVYAKDDTVFNESFATAVERLGGARWLARHGSPTAKSEFMAHDQRRSEFRALTLATRRALAVIYQSNDPLVPVDKAKFAMKNEVMHAFRAQYAQLRERWMARWPTPPEQADIGPGTVRSPTQFSGFDAWVAQANNASFGAQAAYDDLVPAFERIFAQVAQTHTNPWPAFYDEVKRLAALPLAERQQAMKAPIGAGAQASKKDQPMETTGG